MRDLDTDERRALRRWDDEQDVREIPLDELIKLADSGLRLDWQRKVHVKDIIV
jgi:hypothetical protein